MSEAELLSEIVKLCQQLGLLYHHCTSSTRCRGPAGFPDLVIVGRLGVFVAELKSDDGETSAEQDLWLWTLNAAGETARRPGQLWRPADLDSGYIRRALEAIV